MMLAPVTTWAALLLAAPARALQTQTVVSQPPIEGAAGQDQGQLPLPQGAPELPRSAGCFVWLPTGCGKHVFHAKLHWKRDKWGETNMRSGESETACAARKHAFDMWCRREDSVMLFLATAAGEATGAKTYSSLAAAGASQDEDDEEVAVDEEPLPEHVSIAPEWADEEDQDDAAAVGVGTQGLAIAPEWQEDESAAAESAEGAEQMLMALGKARSVPEEIEVEEPKAPPLPTKPGCYLWLPSGCHRTGKNRLDAQHRWRRDFWGERNRGAKDTLAACKSRKMPYNHWCGVDDAKMLFVHSRESSDIEITQEQIEREKHNDLKERSANHPLARWETRWNKPTPVPEAEAVTTTTTEHPEFSEHRAGAPPLPDMGGCYVWLPSGCANHPQHTFAKAKDHWKQDVWGGSTGSGDSGAACSARKTSFDVWCGVQDAVMLRMPFTKEEVAAPEESTTAMPMPELPDQTGCYIWLPTGCRKHSLDAQLDWMRDYWGEEKKGAKISASVCESRKSYYDEWCGVTDAHLVHVVARSDNSPSAVDPRTASGEPALPTVTGCYVWMPSGCLTNTLDAKYSWARDADGEQSKGAKVSATACNARKAHFDQWCGVSDSRMAHVVGLPASPSAVPAVPVPARDQQQQQPSASAQPLPEGAPARPDGPGCYVWTPTGCLKNVLDAQGQWKRDKFGEEKKGARESPAACSDRSTSFNTWCGITDAQMLHVGASGAASSSSPTSSTESGAASSSSPASSIERVGASLQPSEPVPAGAPALPSSAGCFVWMPSGCVKIPDAQGQWKRDKYGEEKNGAKEDSAACGARKASYNTWCGVSDAQMLHMGPSAGSNSGSRLAVSSLMSSSSPRSSGAVPDGAPPLPSGKGCYVWLPSGCKKNHFQAKNNWKKDSYLEKTGRLSAAACQNRKSSFDTWCGVDDAVVLPLLG